MRMIIPDATTAPNCSPNDEDIINAGARGDAEEPRGQRTNENATETRNEMRSDGLGEVACSYEPFEDIEDNERG